MSIPYFDCHCDTISRCMETGSELRENAFHIDLMRLSEFSPAAQVFSICTETLSNPVGKASHWLKNLKDQINKNSDIVKLCLNFNDIISAEKSNKIAALISIEGAEQISSLQAVYDEGVRIVHITWNYDNALCGAGLGNGSGLTVKGNDFVREAQKLGILLDMSHISEAGFWDVMSIIDKPVIAGHSNSRTLCNHKRNLTDEQFIALINCGGGAGINLYPHFLENGRNIDSVISHIEHFMSLGGEKAVFLGCDFDGIEITPTGLSGVEDIPKLYEGLLKLNYPESIVRDIFYYNIRGIMEKVL